MNTINLQKERGRIIEETHSKPKCSIPYPKQVVFTRGLLIFAQVLLDKIENKENVLFNSELYPKIITE